MSRYTGPKNRIARKFGENVFGRLRNPMLHKPNPPGMHGAKRKKKSDFGLQLDEKQKLKAVYGMLTEKQLVGYYKKAERKAGNTANHFVELLECRLDNVVYRLKFGSTIFAAQQLVSHGHILVDGKKVDRRSFIVRPGMVITVKEGSRKMKAIQASLTLANREVPAYLSAQPEQFAGQLLMAPEFDQIPMSIAVDVTSVCEFLAHST